MKKEIVQYIISQLENNRDREVIVQDLIEKYELDKDTAFRAIEMTSTGLFRSAFLDTNSFYPKSDIDEDPFLVEAIKIGLERIKNNPSDPEKTKGLDELIQDYYKGDDQAMTLYKLNNADFKDIRIEEIFIDAIHSEKPNIRIHGLSGIRSRKIKSAIPVLKKKIIDNSDEEKLNYARALYELEEEEFALEIFSDLAKSEVTFVRYDTAAYLGSTKGEKAIKILKELTQDPSKPVEYDENGFPTRFTMWSVGIQAEKSLEKIANR